MPVTSFHYKFINVVNAARIFLVLLSLMPAMAFSLGLENAGVIGASGTDTGLLSPSAIWHDNIRGYIVVANTQARQVVVLNQQGQAVKVFGKKGELALPVAVAGTGEGTLYIAERGSETLKVMAGYDTAVKEEYRTLDLLPYRRSTTVQTVALFIDQGGNIYIADRGNRQVIVLDRDEKFKFAIQGVGEPTDLWVERTGEIFVADPGFGGIRVYNAQGLQLRTLAGGHSAQFREPLRVRGMAIDRMGRIWVVEETGQKIRAIDSRGTLLLNYVSGLFSPVDLAVDDKDHLYVLEQGGNRIAVFRISGF